MDELALPRGPVLVVAPHPDDESLGCGALLAAMWAGGGSAHVACLTDGAASHPGSRTHPPDRLRLVRQAELRRAVAILGGTEADVTFLDLPDAASHRVAGPGGDPARTLGALANRIGAAVLAVASPLDPHCDHGAAAAAALRVAKARPRLRLMFYPVWSRWVAGGTAPAPERTVPLAFDAPSPRKAAAIAAHESQQGRVVRDDPDGFSMPPGFAAMFADAPEVYFEARP